MGKQPVQWHSALEAVFRIELGKEAEKLSFEREHLLSSKSLQIDLLIVKKKKEVEVHKNIGRIFREHNIIEYKSPGDDLSINDFYKVYGYACFYQADTKHICEIKPSELTITFVTNHYPREMLRHLREVRGMNVREIAKGIYYLEGDAIPMQLLINNKLSEEENYWLHSLRNDLKAGGEIKKLIQRYEDNKTDKWYEALMEVIVQGNLEQVEEEQKMCDALRALFEDELQESKKLAAKEGEEKGEKKGEKKGIQLAKQVWKLFSAGASIDVIAKECNISEALVKEILE